MNAQTEFIGERRPIAVDLFSGAGGFSLGLEQAGFDVVAAVEFDPIHAAVHEFNFPGSSILCADASDENNVNRETLHRTIRDGLSRCGLDPRTWDEEIDAVVGGPPCQGFSMMGNRDLNDPRNKLVFAFARIVEELKPRYFVMENVPGIVSGRHASILTAAIERLVAAGYVVENPRILNAMNFGVPQDRRRMILMGSRKDCAPAPWPRPTVVPVQKRGGRNSPQQQSLLPVGPTVWQAIRDLPDIDRRATLRRSDEISISNSLLRELDKKSSPYARCLRGAADDPDDFSYPRAWDRNLLTNSMLTCHESSVVQRFADTERGGTEPISRFYRLHPNGLSTTLRAGTGRDHGGYTSARPIHPNKARVITVREAARLHGFPDWFRFSRAKWHGFRQVGNSIPPPLAKAIGSCLVLALDKHPIKPTRHIQLGDPNSLTLGNKGAAARFVGRTQAASVGASSARQERQSPNKRCLQEQASGAPDFPAMINIVLEE